MNVPSAFFTHWTCLFSLVGYSAAASGRRGWPLCCWWQRSNSITLCFLQWQWPHWWEAWGCQLLVLFLGVGLLDHFFSFFKGAVFKRRCCFVDRATLQPYQISHGNPIACRRVELRRGQDERGSAGMCNGVLLEHAIHEDVNLKSCLTHR